MFSCELCEISKNTFFYKTPPVDASATCVYLMSLSEGLLCTSDIVILPHPKKYNSTVLTTGVKVSAHIGQNCNF